MNFVWQKQWHMFWALIKVNDGTWKILHTFCKGRQLCRQQVVTLVFESLKILWKNLFPEESESSPQLEGKEAELVPLEGYPLPLNMEVLPMNTHNKYCFIYIVILLLSFTHLLLLLLLYCFIFFLLLLFFGVFFFVCLFFPKYKSVF